jgi:hypothetical protein
VLFYYWRQDTPGITIKQFWDIQCAFAFVGPAPRSNLILPPKENPPTPIEEGCKHEKTFPEFNVEIAKNLSVYEVRKLYPRFSGNCPDCGVYMIAYGSYEHYLYGDW